MDPANFGLIEILLVFAIALGLLGFELFSIRRTIRMDEERFSSRDDDSDPQGG